MTEANLDELGRSASSKVAAARDTASRSPYLRGILDINPSQAYAGAPSLPLHATGRAAGMMAPAPPAARPEVARSMRLLQELRMKAASGPQETWGRGRAVPLPGPMDPGRLLRLRTALRRSLPVTSKAAEHLLRRKLRA